MKHGVVRLEDGTYEFYWMGNRLSLEEFNDQTFRTASSVCEEIKGIAMGMDMAQHFDDTKITLAQVKAIEDVLKLPLCDACRRLIG